jgi:hypothetical protein
MNRDRPPLLLRHVPIRSLHQTLQPSPLQNYYLAGNLTTQSHTKLYADENYTFSAALYPPGACYCVAPLLSSTGSQLLALSMRNHRDPINSFTICTVNGCRANVS